MTQQDIIGLALVYLIIAASIGIAVTLEHRGSKADVRKLLHIGVGFFVFVWWMFSENWLMLVFFTVPVALILFLGMIGFKPISESKLGHIANDKGHSTGLFLYAVSITVLVAFFWDHWTAATIGVVAMTWGDGFGSIIGKRYGKHRIINGKSLEGSLGVFAATAVMTAMIVLFYGFLISSGYYPGGDATANVPLWVLAPIAGVCASIIEAICPGEYDNIVMPLAVAGVMVLLGL